MPNVFSKCKQPWNMFEMGRSNALIRIGGNMLHTFQNRKNNCTKTHTPSLFLKLKPTKRGIELGNP